MRTHAERLSLSAALLVALWGAGGGCYSPKPPPEIIEGGDFSAVARKEHRGLPAGVRSLTADLAIEIALANNPDYQSAKHAMVAAWARFYQSLAPYLPVISANMGAQQNQYTPGNGGSPYAFGGNSRWNPTYTAGLSGQWMVFNGLVDTMNMLAARSGAKEAEAQNQDARRLLVQSVVLAYNSILLSRARIQIAEADALFQEQMVADTQLKYDAGASSLQDVLNFQIEKNNADNTVVAAKFEYENALLALASLMGLTASEIPEEIEFPPLQATSNKPYSLGVEFYLDMAINQRPDLRAFKESLQASRYSLYSKWGAFSPTVSLFMNYGFQRNYGNDLPGNGPENYPVGSARPRSQDLYYNYGVNANWVLFEGGSRLAQVRQAEALLAQAKERLASKWIEVVTQVRQSYAKLQANIVQSSILEETLKMTRKQRDLVREEYNAGNTSIPRLNDAQRALVTAELKHINALIEIENAKAQLDAAAGVR